MKQNILRCSDCGNVIFFLNESGVMPHCCEKSMEKIVANTVEASLEKHIPIVKIEENQVLVTVGSIEHPMTEEHYIEWIMLETEDGIQIRFLHPQDTPTATFITSKPIICVSAYCNVHGLWVAA